VSSLGDSDDPVPLNALEWAPLSPPLRCGGTKGRPPIVPRYFSRLDGLRLSIRRYHLWRHSESVWGITENNASIFPEDLD
jgi:hypothetical protein